LIATAVVDTGLNAPSIEALWHCVATDVQVDVLVFGVRIMPVVWVGVPLNVLRSSSPVSSFTLGADASFTLGADASSRSSMSNALNHPITMATSCASLLSVRKKCSSVSVVF